VFWSNISADDTVPAAVFSGFGIRRKRGCCQKNGARRGSSLQRINRQNKMVQRKKLKSAAVVGTHRAI
jgi:hypothetical protein